MKRKRIRIGQTIGLNGHGDYRDYLEYLHSRFEANIAYAKTLPYDMPTRAEAELNGEWCPKRHHYAVVFGTKMVISSADEYRRYKSAGITILPA